MSEKLGLINYDNDGDEVFIGRDLAHTGRGYGEEVAGEIDRERSEVLSIPVISVDSTLSVSIMMNWMHA